MLRGQVRIPGETDEQSEKRIHQSASFLKQTKENLNNWQMLCGKKH